MSVIEERRRWGIFPYRECKRCGAQFGAEDLRLRYCDRCRDDQAVTAAASARPRAVTASVLGSQLWRVCDQCGCGFRPRFAEGRWVHRRADVRYCSNACRQRAYRQRLKAASHA